MSVAEIVFDAVKLEDLVEEVVWEVLYFPRECRRVPLGGLSRCFWNGV